MAAKIFISYRRDDSIAVAGRLYDRLAAAFGAGNVFMDVDQIPAGVDFAEFLSSQLAMCELCLVLIGPHWLDAKDKHDQRRLGQPDDFVTIEIATALTRNIRVIPVLVDGAQFPRADELPDRLRALVRRNAVEISNTHFGRDVEPMITQVRSAIRGQRPARARWPLIAGGAALLALVLAGAGVYLARNLAEAPPWLAWRASTGPTTTTVANTAAISEDARKSREAQTANVVRKAEDTWRFGDARKALDARKSEEQRKTADASDATATHPKADAARQSQETSNAAEAARKALEAGRAEAARKAAEALKAEEARKADDVRKAAEAAKAEVTRKAAETAKTEATRKAAEAAKAEATRKALEASLAKAARTAAEARQAEAALKAAPTDIAAGIEPGSGRTFRDPLKNGQACEMCPQLVVVPDGRLLMGSSPGEIAALTAESPGLAETLKWETPVREIVLPRKFAVGRTHVTWADFKAFVDATHYKAAGGCYTFDGNTWTLDGTRSWASPGFMQTDQHPVVCVSFADATAYASWLSERTGRTYRLLSEAEAEYAARAPGGGNAATYPRYFFGDAVDSLCTYGNGASQTAAMKFGWEAQNVAGCRDGYVFTAPVASFKANAWGLHDVHGNVWSWTADCWNDDHAQANADGAARMSGDCSHRVVRGGSWSNSPRDLRAGTRDHNAVTDRTGNLGFRLARVIDP